MFNNYKWILKALGVVVIFLAGVIAEMILVAWTYIEVSNVGPLLSGIGTILLGGSAVATLIYWIYQKRLEAESERAKEWLDKYEPLKEDVLNFITEANHKLLYINPNNIDREGLSKLTKEGNPIISRCKRFSICLKSLGMNKESDFMNKLAEQLKGIQSGLNHLSHPEMINVGRGILQKKANPEGIPEEFDVIETALIKRYFFKQ